ncbi:MAG: DUF6496 domain-containing protein [Bdellovibrionia bacterium]
MARYSQSSRKSVGKALHEKKKGKLRSGKKGPKVKSRRQAIAIGLSEARRSGKKVPSRGRKKTTSSRRKKSTGSKRRRKAA